jgi:hypothetical protein
MKIYTRSKSTIQQSEAAPCSLVMRSQVAGSVVPQKLLNLALQALHVFGLFLPQAASLSRLHRCQLQGPKG